MDLDRPPLARLLQRGLGELMLQGTSLLDSLPSWFASNHPVPLHTFLLRTDSHCAPTVRWALCQVLGHSSESCG